LRSASAVDHPVESEGPCALDAIALGVNPPDDVNVVIEVPIGGEPIKYEMDKAAGTLVVDRFLHTPMRYPGNYDVWLGCLKGPLCAISGHRVGGTTEEAA
jgi:Inorganic pyrophosphatase